MGDGIPIPANWNYRANLDMLRNHSKFFAERFVTGFEWCCLDSTYFNSHDEFTTVLKIMRYIDILELVRPDTRIDKIPYGSIRPEELDRWGIPRHEVLAPFDGTESFTFLFNLWLCGDQIRSISITRYLMVVMFRRPMLSRQYLSTQIFNEYWVRTRENRYAQLRKMLITILLIAAPFENDFQTRSQVLKEVPDEVKDLMIHQMVYYRQTPIDPWNDFLIDYDIRQSIEV